MTNSNPMSAISFVDSPVAVHQSPVGVSSFEKAHGPAFLEAVFEFESIVQQPLVYLQQPRTLTLARIRGVDATPPPHEFFWNGRQTAWRIALKFCTAYGASFAQLLTKN